VEARQLHAHPAAHAANARRRHAAQRRRASAPCTRHASRNRSTRPDGTAEPAAQTARPRPVRTHAHHRRAADRPAPWLHVERPHRRQAHAHAARSVLARVVRHLHARLARRRARRVAHERLRRRPRGAAHRATEAAREHAERLRGQREAAAAHRQRRAALRCSCARREPAHRCRRLVRVLGAAPSVLLAVHRERHRRDARSVHRRRALELRGVDVPREYRARRRRGGQRRAR